VGNLELYEHLRHHTHTVQPEKIGGMGESEAIDSNEDWDSAGPSKQNGRAENKHTIKLQSNKRYE
jgi:hypothetical protein